MVSKRAAKAAASSTPPPPISTDSPPIFPSKKVDPTKRIANHYPDSPDTPTASHGDSTSPEPNSPQTPVGPEDLNAKIHSYDDSPIHLPFPTFNIIPTLPDTHPLKSKMFAFAAPVTW